jgi:hypothetical protein
VPQFLQLHISHIAQLQPNGSALTKLNHLFLLTSSKAFNICIFPPDDDEPCLARTFLIVAPACYPIFCCPRKRALGVSTSSDGGASTSTAVAVGQRTGAHHYLTMRLGLAACHVWHSVRCLAVFRSLSPLPPFHLKYICTSEANS